MSPKRKSPQPQTVEQIVLSLKKIITVPTGQPKPYHQKRIYVVKREILAMYCSANHITKINLFNAIIQKRKIIRLYCEQIKKPCDNILDMNHKWPRMAPKLDYLSVKIIITSLKLSTSLPAGLHPGASGLFRVRSGQISWKIDNSGEVDQKPQWIFQKLSTIRQICLLPWYTWSTPR